MKTSRSLFAAGLMISTASVFAASSAIPERQPKERYDKLPQDSPFALATVAVPVSEPVKGWASNLYVGGIGKEYAEGKEQIYVGVKERGGQISFSLYGSEPGYEDISVAGIEWSDQLEKVKVTLKKGTEFATIKYDEAVIKAPAASAAPVVKPGGPGGNPNSVRPGVRPPAGAVPRPNLGGGTAMPQGLPSAKVTLPSNTNSAPPANAAPENNNRRVRVIKSSPQ